jgi:anaerobic ribonucleoside-triphosphate reductase activating protein
MNYGEIKKIDIANGEGVRVSLFVSGCRIHCEGCFNRCTWNFYYGSRFTSATEREIFDALSPDFISGLTVLGGEPFEEENQAELAPFLSRVKRKFPQKTIWCYTGYVYDTDILPADGKKHTDFTDEFLRNVDVLVDGRFIQEEKDITLQFRGSRNQRILKLH